MTTCLRRWPRCWPAGTGPRPSGGCRSGLITGSRRSTASPAPWGRTRRAGSKGRSAGSAAAGARHVAGRAASIGEDFAAERALLLPLPPEQFATAAVAWPRVDRYARVSVGKCRYSVPARLIGSRVRVMLSANELRVFDGARLAAAHPRLIAAGDEHLELDHYLEILVR